MSALDFTELPLTDLGNAERLAARFGHRLRYCHPWGKWLQYDGRRWRTDDTGEIHRLAATTARLLLDEARDLAQLAQTAEELERQRLIDMVEATVKWSKRSEGVARINAMVELARSRPNIAIKPEAMDSDPWLFNAVNATIDLRTGDLQPHGPQDLITKLAPVQYDPEARYGCWDDFLERVLPSPAVRDFVQRVGGYSLTGMTTEEKLFFLWGPTATGKSTLLRAICAAMGDYAATADFSTFLQKDHRGPSNDIARLDGKRLVVSIEVDQGSRFAEGLVQQLTGGDVVTARFMYGEFFEFIPQFKLWLAANDRPSVRDDNDAIWRRILQVHFSVQIPEEDRDDDIKAALSDPDVAGPAVLTWLVQGCLQWQQYGLQVPGEVQATTQDYRREMDPLADFLEESCILFSEARVRNPDLWTAYLAWCQENHVRYPMGRKGFTQRIKALRGVRLSPGSGSRDWHGIGLLSPELVTNE